MEQIFFEITVLICLAAVLTIIFRILKQPAILAYILTGILLGPIGIFHFKNVDALQTFGQLGITLLLFMLGLELKLKELRSIGKTAIILGSAQMILTFIIGYGLSLLFGFPSGIAVYLAIALSFSSTIIIVKLLSDKKDLNSLHGKLAIGILLVQDFFAILTIIFLSGSNNAVSSTLITSMLLIGLKLIVIIGWIMVVSHFIFPRITSIIARSSESLFLFSLAWVFALTALVTSPFIGFSIEIGGFLAGLALANTNENFQIIARMKALRDFFITIFFVTLGIQMQFTNTLKVIVPAIILSAFVLILKPLIVMAATGAIGYRKRTSFFVGISMGQISEFSLIILFLGNTKHIIPNEVVTIVVVVGIISFILSTYAIQNTNKLYKRLEEYLSILEFRNRKHDQHTLSETSEIKDHVVVVGAHEMGQSIIHALKDTGEEVLVIDFNPDLVKKLQEKGMPIFFGDIADSEIQERASLNKAKLVISTVPDMEDNLLLIEGMNRMNRRAKVVVMAVDGEDAKILYKAGADYVVLPQLAGGRHLAKILIDKRHLELIEDYKAKDIAYLKQ